jgi:hypothetical protein
VIALRGAGGPERSADFRDRDLLVLRAAFDQRRAAPCLRPVALRFLACRRFAAVLLCSLTGDYGPPMMPG